MKLHNICENTEDLSVLYHGTNIENLRIIEKEGLDPQKSFCAEDEEENDFWTKHGAPYHFIYLTPYIETAQDFANENEMVILKVTLPPELQHKLITNRGEFIRAPFLIPPQYISRV